MNEFKEYLKSLALKIRETKDKFKKEQRENSGWGDYTTQKLMDNSSWEFRHRHIAYCLIRGRTRKEIEQPREENKPDEALIEKHLEVYREALRDREE